MNVKMYLKSWINVVVISMKKSMSLVVGSDELIDEFLKIYKHYIRMKEDGLTIKSYLTCSIGFSSLTDNSELIIRVIGDGSYESDITTPIFTSKIRKSIAYEIFGHGEVEMARRTNVYFKRDIYFDI